MFYIIPEIRYAIGLVEQLKQDVIVITSHKHPALSYLREQGITIWCAEEHGHEPPYHAHGLLLLPEVRAFIEGKPYPERLLVTFKNSPPFTLQAKRLRAKVLMPSFKLNRFWEDKNRGLGELAKAGVAVKTSLTDTWLNLSYAGVCAQFNSDRLVVQKPFGMAGNSTFFVNSDAEWQALNGKIGENPLVKITPYLDGESFTVNCLLLPSGEVKSSYPMLQITGDKRFTRFAGGTCGIDMTGTRTFSAKFLKELAAALETIGQTMQSSKFWGWFGVDILISNGECVVLEINPRFTASISIFSQAQYLQTKHSFWQEYFEGNQGKWQTQQPLPYTSLLLRNTESDELAIKGNFKPGIYTFEDDGLKLVNNTIFLKDLLSPGQYLIVNKGEGTKIHVDGEMATIVAYGSATQAGSIDANLAKVANLVRIALVGESDLV